MNNIAVMIVDDDPEAVAILEGFAGKLERINVVSGTTDPISALNLLGKTSVDILFLDVEMSELSGLDFFGFIPAHTKVVLCSGNKLYAYDGFQHNVVDFLHKPFSFTHFLTALKKAEEAFNKMVPAQVLNDHMAIFFARGPQKNTRKKFNYEDVVLIEAQRDQIEITFPDEVRRINLSFQRTQGILPKHIFVKVHRSFIVSKIFFKEYVNNKIYLRYVNKPIPVGNKKEAQAFFDWMDKYTL